MKKHQKFVGFAGAMMVGTVYFAASPLTSPSASANLIDVLTVSLGNNRDTTTTTTVAPTATTTVATTTTTVGPTTTTVAPTTPPSTVAPTAPRRAADFDSASFSSVCEFSHAKPDDPIVFPRQPGASHVHDFLGNPTTDAYSTTESLVAAPSTTCGDQPKDKSAYWVPSLLRNGAKIDPISGSAYYTLGTNRDAGNIKPFPTGFRLVFGNSKATAPQGANVTQWKCLTGTTKASKTQSTPPTCDSSTDFLAISIRAMPCWDGINLDSADHKSHMAPMSNGICPSTHPVAVPILSITVKYPISDGSGVMLSSGGVYSGHADFFNAWDPATFQELIDRCVNGIQKCR